MEKTGLAWDVQRVAPEAMERKRMGKPTRVTYPHESLTDATRERRPAGVA